MQAVTVDRNLYIGGSDIPVIMGISPFKTRFDLLLEKAELKEDNFEGNQYTEYGNELEPKIRDFINDFLKTDFVEGKHINGDIRCHTDGEDEDTILEIKTTSHIYSDVNAYQTYLVQLLFYMCETGKEKGILAVYERDKNFNTEFDSTRLNLYDINIEDYEILISIIYKEVEKFRIDLEKIKKDAFITEEDLLPTDITQITNKILVLEDTLKRYDELKKQQDKLKGMLKKSMEKNNVKTWETPNGIKITLVADSEDKIKKVFDEEKFKEENIDLYNNYLEDKIVKGRKGYVRITQPKEEK